MNPQTHFPSVTQGCLPFLASLIIFASSVNLEAQHPHLPFSRTVIFGGEISDTGNASQIYGFPFRPYFDGRFSNGHLAVEHFANALNLPVPVASEKGGSNYAVAGAPLIGSNVMARYGGSFDPDNVGKQINTMLAAEELTGDELIIIIAGENDQYVEGNGFGGNEGIKTADAMNSYISELADAGGKYFLISNLFTSGLRPSVMEQSQNAKRRMENWQEDYHNRLETVVSGLQGRNDITVFYFDWAGWHEEWSTDARQDGFKLSELACRDCNLGQPTSNASNSIAPDPENYIFWDGLRFTTVYQEHLANAWAAFIRASLPLIEDDSPLKVALDPTKTQMALSLPAAPSIDGILDSEESWAWAGGAAQNFWSVRYDEGLEDLLRGGGFGDGNPDEIWDETDIQFNMYAGVFENDLYVAVEVTDDWVVNDNAEANSEDGPTWEDDSVEIFIDGDNSNFQERNTDGISEIVDTGGQFVITANNARRDKEAGDPSFGENADWYAKAALTDSGYVAEFRISLDLIGNPELGQAIGFSIGVNDDDQTSRRQIMWVGSPHNESTYGNLFIGERTYTAPKTSAPSLDGKVDAFEYEGALPIELNQHTGSYHVGVGNDEWEDGDHSLTGWVTHDDTSIYIGIIAEDDVISTDSAATNSEDEQTWVDDSIEIFFDADDSNAPQRDTETRFEGQFVFTPNGARRDNEANNPTWGKEADWFAATSSSKGGYQMEFKFSKAALLEVSEGDRLGFNIALNDDDGNGRKAQLNWAGAPHREFSYGALVLGGESGSGKGDSSEVQLTRSAAGIILQWEGNATLQTAASINGPWKEVDGAVSGVEIPFTEAQAFYRVK
jgi:phospholipase/lecithinase/hemolysin